MATLYTKYRPKTFDGIIGQSHIIDILKAEVAKNKISHAYLFVGPRGTGKTSTARILARAVNCQNISDGNPCGTCKVCSLAEKGGLLDIIEIDAASNRRIDEIRSLKEKIEYRPAVGKYKVYIIDEVHMLTREAFNALLKTLEEPPEHAIFILATTEPHKVPITIASRCERFEFRLGSTEELKQVALQIAKAENIEIQEEALEIIVKHAAGSYRDLLSLLDSFLSRIEDGKITYQLVKEGLGLPDETMIFYFLSSVYNKEQEKVFEMLDEIFHRGINLDQFLKAVIATLRDIALLKTSNKPLPEGYEFLQEFSMASFLHFIGLLLNAQTNLKDTFDVRLPIQLAVLEMVDYLNTNYINGNNKNNSNVSGQSSQNQNNTESLYYNESVQKDVNGVTLLTHSRTGEVGGVKGVTSAGAKINKLNNSSALDNSQERKLKKDNKTKLSKKTAKNKKEGDGNSQVSAINSNEAIQSEDKKLNKKSSKKIGKESADKSKVAGGSGDLSIEQLKEMWPEFLNKLKPYNGHLYAFLLQAQPKSLSFNSDLDSYTLLVEVKYRFHKDRIELVASQQAIAEVSKQMFNKVIKVQADINPNLIAQSINSTTLQESGQFSSRETPQSASSQKSVGVNNKASDVGGNNKSKQPGPKATSRANKPKKESDLQELSESFDDVFADAVEL